MTPPVVAGNTLALSVGALAFAVASVLSVSGQVEAQTCGVPDDPRTCSVVVGR